MYEVNVTANAVKKIARIPKEYGQKIYHKIFSLREMPRPEGCIKLKAGKDLWRIRVGPYRVIYIIDDDEEVILVTKVLHRKDAY